jgi:ribonuclease VapC
VIVVDASALVAIALNEPEKPVFTAILKGTDIARIASINYVETGLILKQGGYIDTRDHLDEWLETYGVVVDDQSALSSAALEAYLRFGKGLHPARLNLGDCFAYALAKTLDVPLLYKGDDFARTDIRSALQPT